MRALLAAGLAVLLAGCEGKLMSATDLVQPLAQPTERIPYGSEPSQFVEHWRALGRGARRAPPVILIHGGCWQSQYGRDLMNPMAEALRREGYNVWNVEYRRLGEPGGGYPGTFQDVAKAVDMVKARVGNEDRLVVVGHSAGGHLALWASGRPSLPEDSPLRTETATPLPAVLSLGGVGDLEAAAADPTFSGACGTETIAKLVGAGARPGDPYADTSPVRLPAPDTRQIMLHGAREQITPAALGEAYVAKITEAGGRAEVVTVGGAGHFEVISPDSGVWARVVGEVERLSRGL